MSFDFTRNLSGATKFVSDSFSSAKETASSLYNSASDAVSDLYNTATDKAMSMYDSFMGNNPVPNTPDEQTKAAQNSMQTSGTNQYNQRIEQSLANYKKWYSEESSMTRQSRAQEFLNTNNFAVRLENPQNGDVVVFRVSPEHINESRQAIYKPLEPLHMPGAVQIYTHTTPRNWSLSGIKLVSRNGIEAEDNLETVNLLRSWLTPYFGESSTLDKDNYKSEMLGAPPPVLLFSAYSDGKFKSPQQGSSGFGRDSSSMGILRSVPVVIQTLNIPFSNDVDYIQTETSKQPFPAITSLDLQLTETHSPAEYSKFNITEYKQGKLEGF